MSRISLIALAFSAVVLPSMALAVVDEVALKGTTPNLPRTVLNPRASANYTGTNVGGIDWTRPFADGTCCSGLGPVKYSAQEFSVSAAESCDVLSVQNGWDGYLFVYSSPFDPNNQTANFVAGDDDGGGGIGTSDIIGVNLAPATTYVVVTTGFANGDEGTFANTINCPTATVTLGAFIDVPAVPAPAMGAGGLTVLALILGLVGIAVVRSRGQ
jgi:hypothetical protein